MPYITEDRRDELDPKIDSLVEAMHLLPNGVNKGDLNYIFSRLAVEMDPKNYSDLADIISTFECAKMEFYRRIIGPYEDSKIKINKDVPGFVKKGKELLQI